MRFLQYLNPESDGEAQYFSAKVIDLLYDEDDMLKNRGERIMRVDLENVMDAFAVAWHVDAYNDAICSLVNFARNYASVYEAIDLEKYVEKELKRGRSN